MYFKQFKITGKIQNKEHCIIVIYVEYSRYEFKKNDIEIFHEQEIFLYNSCKSDIRKQEIWHGYYVAKKALSYLNGTKRLNEICITKGIFGFPVNITDSHYSVNWSHCDNKIVAIAYSNQLMIGIDIEKIDKKREHMLNRIFDYHNRIHVNLNNYEKFTLFWTAYESLSKALKIGLTVSINIFEIKDIIYDKNKYKIYYKNFPDFIGVSFEKNEYFITFVYPKKLNLDI